MSKQLALLGIVGFLVLTPSIAKAQGCWGYFDPPPGQCSDAGGCQGEYARTECVIGCAWGYCNDNNSTDCCGQIHYYAQFYGIAGGDCSGVSWCGYIPARAALREKRRGRVKDMAKPKLRPEDSFLAYRPPRILLLPNRCTNVYEPFFEDYVPERRKGGM